MANKKGKKLTKITIIIGIIVWIMLWVLILYYSLSPLIVFSLIHLCPLPFIVGIVFVKHRYASQINHKNFKRALNELKEKIEENKRLTNGIHNFDRIYREIKEEIREYEKILYTLLRRKNIQVFDTNDISLQPKEEGGNAR